MCINNAYKEGPNFHERRFLIYFGGGGLIGVKRRKFFYHFLPKFAF